jgi:hypothetical protein
MRTRILALSLLLASGPAFGQSRAVEIINSLPQYLVKLQKAANPEAQAIAKQIGNGRRNLAVHQAAARKAGIPLTPRELQKPVPPTAQNAAPDYRRLTQLLKEKPIGEAEDKIVADLGGDAVHSEADLGTLRKVLADHADVMELVHRAADKPQCNFNRDWSQATKLQFPENATMREAARLLRAESYLMAKDGNYHDAVANLARGFRIAGHAASDPYLIGYLVGVAIDAVTLRGMESILYLGGPNAAVADEVREAVAKNRPALDFRKSMDGEAVALSVALAEMRRGGPRAVIEIMVAGKAASGEAAPPQAEIPAKKLTPEEKRAWDSLMDAVEADLLHQIRLAAARAAKPFGVRKAGEQQAEATASIQTSNPIELFRSVLLPDFYRVDIAGLRARAREEALIAGAAVLAFRAKRGGFPDLLQEALPSVPQDPFSGKPLEYRRESRAAASGFVVYSVGPEGDFSGGKPGVKTAEPEAYFRYPATVAPKGD